jgi:metal-responsive CopG/Arc/MetJ family transcriptional regulator
MRTIVDIPKEQLQALTRLCRRHRISRAEAVRRAITCLVDLEGRDEPNQAFGLWSDRSTDGLTYQEELRREWGDA